MSDPSLSRVTPRDHSLGYQTQYQNDSIFAHNIHKIAALAFIHPDVVINAFERLFSSLGDDYEDIIDYFGETYIGRLRPNQTRRQPKFAIDFWNTYHRTTEAVMRTNNAAEAYHRRIGSVFQCLHPTPDSFLEKLIKEENATHMDILHINAG
ncbi:unnamed protein product [Didymodactylos carnosus]|nr:unnamed protein product [Didymodactylos carnosus]CAF3813011.1 unnamed protein product [Didymodactylos carnosus]